MRNVFVVAVREIFDIRNEILAIILRAPSQDDVTDTVT